jgi:endonuclease/exonuclease/phosphatase (EEP) superfamily protein YafD
VKKTITVWGISLFHAVFILLGVDSQALAAWVDVPDSQVVATISEGSSEPLPSQMSFLTWNIQKAEGQSQWQRDFQSISAGKHFILLQEGVEKPEVLNTLRSVTHLGWLMARSFFMETDHQGTGVITGSLETPWSSVFLRSPDREPVANTAKMGLLSTYRMQDGSRLLVINVHAINFTTMGPFERQMDQIFGLVKGWPEKVILAGDFNTWAPNRTNYLLQSAQAAGLKHVAFQNDPRNLVLDHIFLRGCSAQASVIHSEISSSDHYPITTDLLCAP